MGKSSADFEKTHAHCLNAAPPKRCLFLRIVLSTPLRLRACHSVADAATGERGAAAAVEKEAADTPNSKARNRPASGQTFLPQAPTGGGARPDPEPREKVWGMKRPGVGQGGDGGLKGGIGGGGLLAVPYALSREPVLTSSPCSLVAPGNPAISQQSSSNPQSGSKAGWRPQSHPDRVSLEGATQGVGAPVTGHVIPSAPLPPRLPPPPPQKLGDGVGGGVGGAVVAPSRGGKVVQEEIRPTKDGRDAAAKKVRPASDEGHAVAGVGGVQQGMPPLQAVPHLYTFPLFPPPISFFLFLFRSHSFSFSRT